jgi:hypothetical protein
VSAVTAIRGVRRRLADLLTTWGDVGSTITEFNQPRIVDGVTHWGPATRRRRRTEEYPESDPQEWARMYYQVDAMINELTELKDLALHRHNDLVKKAL